MGLRRLALLPFLLTLSPACARDESRGMSLSSAAFARGAAIPKRHTCDAEDLSPPLAWAGVPAGTLSFAVVVDDPDAQNFTHWLLFDIPAAAVSLPEGVRSGNLPKGAREGANDFGSTGYGGPCPPGGRHRYSFRVYALDVPTLTPPPATKEQFETAIRKHALARAELIGTYQR